MVEDTSFEQLRSEQERLFKNLEDEKRGEELERKVQAEEDAQLASSLSSQRQTQLEDASLLYTETDRINIMEQVATNTSLSKELLGDDVTKENFPVRMASLMKKK